MQVITISGKAQHGKDTAAGILKELLETRENRVLITHYADLLKYICYTFFGWDGAKDTKGRALLQYVGTDIIRNRCPDFWVEFIIHILRLFPRQWDYVLIPDCRFPNEIDCLREAGLPAIHLKVIRSGFESPLTKEQQSHPSETALDHVQPDYIIQNSGSILDLKNALISWLDELSGCQQLILKGAEAL